MDDTSPEAKRVLRARTLGQSVAERVEEGLALSLLARQVMRGGIRMRHPDYSEELVERALARLLWGDELYRAARPDWPLVDP